MADNTEDTENLNQDTVAEMEKREQNQELCVVYKQSAGPVLTKHEKGKEQR